VYLNLHKKIYFAPFYMKYLSRRTYTGNCRNYPKPKLYRDFLWYKPKL